MSSLRVVVACLAACTALLCASSVQARRSSEQMGVHDVNSYGADSGGCPAVKPFEEVFKEKTHTEWHEWRKRLPDLANKSPLEVYNALGDNVWMQYIDGWAQLKGKDVFGAHYVQDETAAHNMAGERLNKDPKGAKFDSEFFGKVHDKAFEQSAKELEKKSAFRDTGNYIYLPLPTRRNVDLTQLYSGVKEFGKPNDIREVKPTKNHKLSGQYQWSYKPKSVAEIKKLCDGFFQEFEKNYQAANGDWNKVLDAVVHLYSSLENIHPFLDGVGRTDQIVLNFYLSRVGLHPVSLYNTMESALSDEKDERQHILHAYLMWEEHYKQKKSAWTLEAIQDKGKECMPLYQKLGFKPKKDPTHLDLKEAMEPVKSGEAAKKGPKVQALLNKFENMAKGNNNNNKPPFSPGPLTNRVKDLIAKFNSIRNGLNPSPVGAAQSNLIAKIKAGTLSL